MIDVLLVGAEEIENLGTRYLAAVLRGAGYTVELAAFSSADDMGAVIDHARACEPRLIGLSIIFQYRAAEFLTLAAELRRTLPDAHITCGGHFVSFTAGELIRDYAALDSVVRGEGELTLLELVNNLDAPEKWKGIRGLSFRSDGKVLGNSPRPLISDLDTLPFPARDVEPARFMGVGISPIVGSRGCYRDCAFCSIRAFYGASRGRIQRFRSVPNLVDEMEWLYRVCNVSFFIFNDDEWFPPGRARMDRVDAFEAELKRRKLEVIMSIKCRADDVEEGLFQRLRDLGVVRAYVGVESGSDHSLRTLNKKTTVAQNRHALETLNRVGMLADFGLIFFDPDTTIADIEANLAFFSEMAGGGQAPLSFGRMEVYAGTPIQSRLASEGRLTGNYLAWNYCIPDPRAELVFRMMIAAMRNRNYHSGGVGKQCSLAYYELTVYEYLMGTDADGTIRTDLRSLVSRVNNHSLGILRDMLRFAIGEDIHDGNAVNEQVTRWASEINWFDLQAQSEIEVWRQRLSASAARLL